MKHILKRRLALAMVLVLCLALLPTTAFAATVSYDAPTQGIAADDNVLNGATAAASTVLFSVLGINITSTNSAGLYDAAGTSEYYGTDSSNLGIFGSDINDSPDPYIYNYFYNLYNTKTGGGDYSDESYSAWTATPYTLRWDANKNGMGGQASGTVTMSLNGVTKTTNPAFFYEPDILIGLSSSSYADELANYQAQYNANYDPVIFSGSYSTQNARSDGLGLAYNQFDMCSGLVYLGAIVQNIMAETGKTTRYDQGPYEIGVNYDKYDRGLYYYVSSLIANGSLTPVRYVTSLSYDSDTGYYNVSQATGRNAQYADGIGVDIYELLDAGYVFSDGSTVEKTEITSTSTGGPGGMNAGGPNAGGMNAGGPNAGGPNAGGANAGGANAGGANAGGANAGGANAGGANAGGANAGGANAGGANAGGANAGGPNAGGPNAGGISGGIGGIGGNTTSTISAFQLTADQLIEILNEPTKENPVATGIVVGSSNTTVDPTGVLADSGIRFLSNLPKCVYGMTMATVENGMGIPYYIGFFYYDQDSSLNPINYIYYWMEHFYHVSDNDAMEDVVNNMLGSADLPASLGLAGAQVSDYNAVAVEEQIAAGIDYYRNVLEPQYQAQGVDEDSALYWKTLDTTVGIGSDIQNTNLLYNFTSAERTDASGNVLTESQGNTLYDFTFTAKDGSGAGSSFTDVPEGQYYTDAVAWAVSQGITGGTNDDGTLFSPNQACDRAQVVTFLYRAAGLPSIPAGTKNPFTDVKESDYYYNAVLWAVANGITGGTNDDGTLFSPNQTCDRRTVATFLWRYEGQPSTSAANTFTDIPAGQYYTDAVVWAAVNGITGGTNADGTLFSPTVTCDRAQIVTFLYRDLA